MKKFTDAQIEALNSHAKLCQELLEAAKKAKASADSFISHFGEDDIDDIEEFYEANYPGLHDQLDEIL